MGVVTLLTPGWHFCAMRDGKPVLPPLVIGRMYEHTGDLRLRESGFHDSVRIIDALQNASGPYLCRTLASGDVLDTDQRCSRYGIAIAGADVTMILHDFATRIAYCALLREREQGREPDTRSWEAVRVKRRWMVGDATDAELRAARVAARPAAWAAARAARDAGWASAWASARASAWASAWASISDAARASASDAARASAWAAAWAAANTMLVDLLPAELREVR